MIAIDAISGLTSVVSTVTADGLNSSTVRKSSDDGENPVYSSVDSTNGGANTKQSNAPSNQSQARAKDSKVTEFNPDRPHTSYSHVQFEVDQETRNTVISVVDDKSNKVLYQIPPEDLRRVTEKIRKALGMIFDETI